MKAQGGRPQGGKPRHRKRDFAAVSLKKFGGIGLSTYDKRAKQEKERALNAARVNAYKKLKKRLGDKLEPQVRLDEVGMHGRRRRRRCHRQQAASATATAAGLHG